jgi:hypothetical protein
MAVLFEIGAPTYRNAVEILIDTEHGFDIETFVSPTTSSAFFVGETKSCKLILDKIDSGNSDIISGYIEIFYDETNQSGRNTNHYYFKGYFKTSFTD